MSSTPAIPFSLRLGEALTLGLGLGTTALLMTIRLWTKLRLSGKMLPEDYISLVAFLAYAGGVSSLMVIVINEYGKSSLELYIVTFAEDVLYSLIVPMIKVSILLQYKTIFVMRRGESMHTVVQSLIYIVVFCYTNIIVATAVLYGQSGCIQTKSNNALCFARQRKMWVASGWFNLVSDVTILLLPLRPIWRLQVPWTSKIRIAAIFGLGIFACAASAIRAYRCLLILRLTNASPTLIFDIDVMGMWSSAEIATGIVVGCLPILPRFIKEYKPSFFTKLCARLANIIGLRKHSNTSSSYTETPDLRLHSSNFNLSQTPAQMYNDTSIRVSRTFSSYEGRSKCGVDERDENYIRLDSVERGEHARKRSSTRPGTLTL